MERLWFDLPATLEPDTSRHGTPWLAALLLESRYARLLVASSAPYWRLQPCGSHPITDPLFSTAGTRVWHDGAETDRLDKIEAIAEDPTALRYLRVCWLGRSGR